MQSLDSSESAAPLFYSDASRRSVWKKIASHSSDTDLLTIFMFLGPLSGDSPAQSSISAKRVYIALGCLGLLLSLWALSTPIHQVYWATQASLADAKRASSPPTDQPVGRLKEQGATLKHCLDITCTHTDCSMIRPHKFFQPLAHLGSTP